MKKSLMVCLTFYLPALLCAEERQFPDHNFALTPPTGWVEITDHFSSGNACLAFGKPDRTAFIAIGYGNVLGNPVMNDKFAADFDRNLLETSGGKRISGRFLDHHGVAGYENTVEIVGAGKTVSLLCRAVPFNGNLYRIQGGSVGIPVANNAEVQAAVESFRFLNPHAQPKSAAYRAGEAQGRLMVTALFIVGAVWVIRKIWADGKRRKPSVPPPLPR